jgi:hypothetical protein
MNNLAQPPLGTPIVKIARVEIGERARIPGDSIQGVQLNVAGPHVIGWRIVLKGGAYIDVGVGAPIVIYYDPPSGLVAAT